MVVVALRHECVQWARQEDATERFSKGGPGDLEPDCVSEHAGQPVHPLRALGSGRPRIARHVDTRPVAAHHETRQRESLPYRENDSGIDVELPAQRPDVR